MFFHYYIVHFAEKQQKEPVIMTQCESCLFCVYDEEYDDYVCDVDMDEDEFVRFLANRSDNCPYWRPGDEYITARKQ